MAESNHKMVNSLWTQMYPHQQLQYLKDIGCAVREFDVNGRKRHAGYAGTLRLTKPSKLPQAAARQMKNYLDLLETMVEQGIQNPEELGNPAQRGLYEEPTVMPLT